MLLRAHILIMVRSNAIRTGCRVSGKIGELVDNPNQAPLPNGKKRRRVRSLATGTVLHSIDHRKWEVRLEYNGKVVQIASSAMKVIESEAGIPMVSYMM